MQLVNDARSWTLKSIPAGPFVGKFKGPGAMATSDKVTSLTDKS